MRQLETYLAILFTALRRLKSILLNHRTKEVGGKWYTDLKETCNVPLT